jgi:hypothetical protein
LNVLDPSPTPKVVPMRSNSFLYVCRDTAAPLQYSHPGRTLVSTAPVAANAVARISPTNALVSSSGDRFRMLSNTRFTP